MSALPPVKKFLSNTGVRIYRIPCQVFENLTARVYLLLGAGRPTLVDAGSGTGQSTEQILAGLETVHRHFGEPIRAADVRRIIITHGHVDHIGGLEQLLHHMPAEVAVHPLDKASIATNREHVVVGNRRLDDFLRRAGVAPERRRELVRISHFIGNPIANVVVGRILADGEDLDGLRILHTPGHSPGHLCLLIGNVLLSADHILAQTVPQQWPESTAAYTGLGHYLESLDKIARTPGIELTLAAHEQAMHDVYGRIETIRGSLRRRIDRLHAAMKAAARPLTVEELTGLLYPEVTGFRAVLAVTDVGSRVEHLHQRGQLVVANLDEVQHEDEPVYRYSLV